MNKVTGTIVDKISNSPIYEAVILLNNVKFPSNDIAQLKVKVKKLYFETFEYCRIAIPDSNMEAFLQQMKIIISQSFVALDFYLETQNNNGKTFTPQQYPRESLICDMGKKKNLLKASYYWIFN